MTLPLEPSTRARKFLAALVVTLLAVFVLTRTFAADTAGAAKSKDPKAGKQAAKDPAKKPPTEKKADAAKPEDIVQHPFPDSQPAPSLDGGVAWINTSGPIDLKSLRGKFVVLDFWTYCCINCMHVLPELKKLEHAYPNELVVIGVHSAKFEGEQDSQNIIDAVQRYEIEHPVINDADHKIWNKYAVNSWPTLRIIDPEGNLVAGNGGEIPFEILDQFMARSLPYYKKKGLLDLKPVHFDLEAHKAAATPLRFPGKVLASAESDRLFIADSNHNRIVVARLDGTLVETIGSGVMGRVDGDFAKAQFDHPQGMAYDGRTLYVADTENHLLRKIDMKTKRVSTIAGTGKQGRGWPTMNPADDPAARTLPHRYVGKPATTAINSPWALWIHDKALYIAMAGPHQIWKMPLDESEIGPYAGNGREDIVDGPLLPDQPYGPGYSSFAQPSGLTSDGEWLYVADSEGSSVRAVPFDPSKDVRTLIGTADLPSARLFTFGDVDGKARQARLQHALDVAFAGGRIYVADTYNNKIKVIDPKDKVVTTIAGSGKPGAEDEPATFDEPAGLSSAGDKLYVADTNNHLIRTVDLKNKNRVATLEIKGLAPPKPPTAARKPSFPGATPVKLDAVSAKPVDGNLAFDISLELPSGYKVNTEAPMSYLVEAAGATGPVYRASVGKLVPVGKPSAKFQILLPLGETTGEETLSISLGIYYCQTGAEGLCKATSVVWTVPVKIVADAKAASVPLKFKVE